MRTKQITRVRGVTIKVGVKTAFLRNLLKEAAKAMMSVANFDAEHDSANEYRRCLDPLYNDLADTLQEMLPEQRPTILRTVKKVEAPMLFGMGFELLHAAGYVKINLTARVEHRVQTVVLMLLPEGRGPVVPALMKQNKMSTTNPIQF